MEKFLKFELPDTWRIFRPVCEFGQKTVAPLVRLQFFHGRIYRVLDIQVCEYEDGADGPIKALTVFLQHPDLEDANGFGFLAEHFNLKPHRTQRTRKSVPGIPTGSVYVGRPSQWGNPAAIGEWFGGAFMANNLVAVSKFYDECKLMATSEPEKFVKWLTPLVDRNLCCWCKIGEPCHADILLALSKHLKPIINDADFRTLIPASVRTWPEISCIIVQI